jgi:capsid protein
VDGDAAMLLTRAESGFPQLRFLTADRIGSRGDDEIKGGPYDGARLINGCIVNRDGRVIAYRVLGPTPEEDVDVSAFNCQLLFEPEWRAQFRGIPRIARTLLDWFDVQDIDAYLKRGVKLDASQGVVHYTETGTADTASDLLSDNEDTSIKDLRIERREGGEILYMKADSGEKVESFKSERPHPNTEAFIARLERRGLLAVGWFYELLDPSKLGGASVRLIQDEARHSIRARQKTIRKRAKRAITYAVAVAMKQKLIPRNEADWWKWDFELPAQLTVDAGYDRAADVEDLKLGLTTEAEVTAKRGKWWEDVRLQKKREVKALLTDAQDIAKEFNIPIQSALDLLSQRNPNPTPITETPDPRP